LFAIAFLHTVFLVEIIEGGEDNVILFEIEGGGGLNGLTTEALHKGPQKPCHATAPAATSFSFH